MFDISVRQPGCPTRLSDSQDVRHLCPTAGMSDTSVRQPGCSTSLSDSRDVRHVCPTTRMFDTSVRQPGCSTRLSDSRDVRHLCPTAGVCDGQECPSYEFSRCRSTKHFPAAPSRYQQSPFCRRRTASGSCPARRAGWRFRRSQG